MSARYEVIMSVVVEADDMDEAYERAVAGLYAPGETIVEEDGIRILPDPIFIPTEKGRAALGG